MFKTVHSLLPDGQPDSLVVLLHGYGADGLDLLDLGREWRNALPHTLFLSPDAPDPSEMGTGGWQWWSLREAMEHGLSAAGLSLALRESGAEARRTPFVQWLDGERQKLGLGWDRVALVGFSQGAMLALHVGLRLPQTPAGIVGFSGALLASKPLQPGEVQVKPPVLLVHGMMDMVVPYAALNIADMQLRMAGIAVESVTRPQLGHGIDGEGLRAAAKFLRRTLKIDNAAAA